MVSISRFEGTKLMVLAVRRLILLWTVAAVLAAGGWSGRAQAPSGCAQFEGGYEVGQEAPGAARVRARESLWRSYREGLDGCMVLRVVARDGAEHEWMVRLTQAGSGMRMVLTVRDTMLDRKEGRRITAISEFEPARLVRMREGGAGAELGEDAVADPESFVLKFLNVSGEVIPNQSL